MNSCIWWKAYVFVSTNTRQTYICFSSLKTHLGSRWQISNCLGRFSPSLTHKNSVRRYWSVPTRLRFLPLYCLYFVRQGVFNTYDASESPWRFQYLIIELTFMKNCIDVISYITRELENCLTCLIPEEKIVECQRNWLDHWFPKCTPRIPGDPWIHFCNGRIEVYLFLN
jgi:hypothetical protein